MATHLKRGWEPHDEGAFGESAVRVLNGQLPHRDFDEIYTGGLAYLHALAFREMGINLAAMRYILFVFFLAWVPAVFYVASRFMSDLAAGAVTLLVVVWSVPNYAAAVPSWYNLFFAVFGAAALLRYLEMGSRRWLFIAGLCGGLSILAKIVGLYYLAGVLLFLIFREQSLAAPRREALSEHVRIYSWIVGTGLTFLVYALVTLVHKVPGVSELVYFVLPTFALAALWLTREFAGVPGRSSQRFAELFRMIAPFAAGAAVPVLTFLIPYLISGSVHALLNGIFVLPAKRLGFAASTSGLGSLVPAVCLAVGLFFAFKSEDSWRRIWGWAFAASGAFVLVAALRSPLMCKTGWFLLGAGIPVTVLLGAVILASPRFSLHLRPLRQQQLMLLLPLTALCSLVQFPFAGKIYFCYVAPLLILTGAGVLASLPRPPRFAVGALFVFYFLFALLIVTPPFIGAMGREYLPDTQIQRLLLARGGGLRVDPGQAQLYERLIPLVQVHAKGQFIYAAPDCPEVYFLSGLQNPTRTLFDFTDDPTGRTERTLNAIEGHRINVAVIKQNITLWRDFSGPLAPELESALKERFPNSEDVGDFEVRWRE